MQILYIFIYFQQYINPSDRVLVDEIKELGGYTNVNANGKTEVSTGDFITTNGTEEHKNVVVYGDVDGSGEVNLEDVIYASDIYGNMTQSHPGHTEINTEAADVQNNGEITLEDVIAISDFYGQTNLDYVKDVPEPSTKALDDVKAEAVAKLEKYKDFMLDENNDEYKSEATKIEEAIDNIGKAETEAEIQEIVDKAIEGVSSGAKEAMKQLEETRQEELDSLQGYVDALSKVDGLSNADKARIQSLVDEASSKIKSANSEEAITKAVSEAETILESGFKNVAMTKAVDEAVEALEAYKDSSKPGMNTYIDNEIKKIKDMLTDPSKKMSDVESAVSEAKEVADPLKKKQEEAYAKLQEYRDYVAKDTSLDEAKKGLINGELDTVLQSVNDADAEAEVTAALTGLDEFMDTYKEVKDGVALENAKKELTKLYNDYLVELAPYLASSSDKVKLIAENAKTSMQKIVEPEKAFATAEEVTEAKTKLEELYEKGNGGKTKPDTKDDEGYYKLEDLKDKDITEDGSILTGFVGYKAILENNDKLAKEKAESDKEQLADALKNAEATLALYEQVLKDDSAIEELELTSEDVANIQKWIDSTKETVKSAKGASEVNSAMNLLNGEDESFLATYYPTYKEYAEDYELSHAKTEVSEKLKELQEQYKDADEEIYGEVKSEIETAISEVDAKTKPEEVRKLLTDIEKKIDDANKKSELEKAKQEAIEKLNLALEKANDNVELKGKITSAISEITALDYNETTKNTPEDVKKIIDKADKEIQTLLEEIEKDRIEKLNESKADVIKAIDQYIEVAKVAENSAVTSQLDRYRNAANSAQTQEELDKIYKADDASKSSDWTSEFYIYLKKSCEVLDVKYEAIYKTTDGVKDKYKDKNDPEQIALINKAIEDIKAVKVATKDEATAEIKKITDQLDKDVNAVEEANKEINQKKTEAIQAIDTAVNTYKNSAIESQLNQAVKTYKEKINAVVKDDKKQYETTISNYKTAAENLIKELVAQFKKEVEKEAKTLENTNEAIEGSVAEKEINEIQGEVTISGSEGSFTVNGGELKDLNSDWNGLKTITPKTGLFLCLKIKNTKAGKITAKLGEDSNATEIIDQGDGTYILVVKLSETGGSTFDQNKAKTLTVSYYVDVNGTEKATDVTYNLSAVTKQGA